MIHFQVCRIIRKKGWCNKTDLYPAGTKNNGSKSQVFPVEGVLCPPSVPPTGHLSTHFNRVPTSVPTQSSGALLIKALLMSHLTHVKAFLQLLVLHVALDHVIRPAASVCVCHHSPEWTDWKRREQSVRESNPWVRSAPQVGGSVLRTTIAHGLHKSVLNGGVAGRKPQLRVSSS